MHYVMAEHIGRAAAHELRSEVRKRSLPLLDGNKRVDIRRTLS
jgi:hypothetical protein